MPLVSVVVATHDRARWLERAIGSALGQTLSDIEIVIVDDASSDETPEVLARLQEADRRVRTKRLSSSRGAAVARNEGIAEAGGDYLAFLDDDDEWIPTKLERQVGYLRDHASVGIIGCHFYLSRTDGRRLLFRASERFKAAALLWDNVLRGASFVMLHRAVLPFEPAFDDRLVVGEDWDLWWRCAREVGAAVVPEPLAVYSQHEVQLTSDHAAVVRGRAEFFDKNESLMSANARAFHRARLRRYASHGFADRWRSRLSAVRASPPEVTALLARLSVSRRLGDLLGDPARPLRTLTRAIERLE